MSKEAFQWFNSIPCEQFKSGGERLILWFLCKKHEIGKPLTIPRGIIKKESFVSDDRTYWRCLEHLEETGLLFVNKEQKNKAHTFILGMENYICDSTYVEGRVCKNTYTGYVESHTRGYVNLHTTNINKENIDKDAENSAVCTSENQGSEGQEKSPSPSALSEGHTQSNEKPIGAADNSTPSEQKPKAKKKPQLAEKPTGVDSETWQDYLILRESKKAPLTKTALKMIALQAEKAKLSLQDVLTICLMRNWQGFRADWVTAEDRAALLGATKNSEPIYVDTEEEW